MRDDRRPVSYEYLGASFFVFGQRREWLCSGARCCDEHDGEHDEVMSDPGGRCAQRPREDPEAWLEVAQGDEARDEEEEAHAVEHHVQGVEPGHARELAVGAQERGEARAAVAQAEEAGLARERVVHLPARRAVEAQREGADVDDPRKDLHAWDTPYAVREGQNVKKIA